MNDAERELWVLNDEDIHGWYLKSKLPMRIFVRSNRDELDRMIAERRDGILARVKEPK